MTRLTRLAVGYSMGSRVIYSCLLSLAERQAFGIVENVILMGSPTPANVETWAAIRAVVSGRCINVWSANDMILGFLYRTSAIQLGVAGLQPIECVEGVENFDMGVVVEGHMAYRHFTTGIWREVWNGETVFDDVREQIELDKAEAAALPKFAGVTVPKAFRGKPSKDGKDAKETKG